VFLFLAYIATDSAYYQEIRLANTLNVTFSYLADLLNKSSINVIKPAENISSKLLNILLHDLTEFNKLKFDNDKTTEAANNSFNRISYLLEANNIYHRFIELIKLISSCSCQVKSLTSRMTLTCLTNFLQSIQYESFQPIKDPEQVLQNLRFLGKLINC
jgi:hypothetical protein